jgi:hypothetical protein
MCRCLLPAVIVLLGVGCSMTRPGVLAPLPSGPEIPVEVEVSSEWVEVRGVDPTTGERFFGRLELDPAAHDDGPRAPFVPPFESAATPGAPRSAVAPAGPQRATMTVSGLLRGDAGTELECTMIIERRIRIHGGGVCRKPGSVEQDPLYRLTFD